MTSMILSFNAIFPLLAFMLLGYCLRRVGLIDRETTPGLNKLVFNVLLPCNIINSVYSADIKSDFDYKIAFFAAAVCILSFAVCSLIVNPIEKDRTVSPVIIQGICKSNYNLLVIPIASSFFGAELGMAAILVMVTSPLVNTCSTIVFETARGRHAGFLPVLKKVLLNPLVLSSIIALLLNCLGLKVPGVIMNGVVSKLSSAATPIAMIALGAGFDFPAMKKWKKHLTAVCVFKLLVMPAVWVGIAAAAGIRGANLIAILVLSGGPAAVNSYSTAVSMGGNSELAGEIVAITSLFSVLTLFAFLTGLGSLGFI